MGVFPPVWRRNRPGNQAWRSGIRRSDVGGLLSVPFFAEAGEERLLKAACFVV
jgi:hypothetical protein